MTDYIYKTESAQLGCNIKSSGNSASQIKIAGEFLQKILSLPKEIITTQEKIVYIRLLLLQTLNISSKNRYFAEASLSQLAKEMRTDRVTIFKILKNLQSEGFIHRLVKFSTDGRYKRSHIIVDAPLAMKATLQGFTEENKNSNLSKILENDLFVFMPHEQIKSIFKMKCAPSVKLTYLQLFFESYKNKVKNKKENLECYVEFTKIGKKIDLGGVTVSKAVKYLHENGRIKLQRMLYCWKVKVFYKKYGWKSQSNKESQGPISKKYTPLLHRQIHNKIRGIEKTRSENFLKKSDFLSIEVIKKPDKIPDLTQKEVCFLQNKAKRSFTKPEIEQILSNMQKKSFWQKIAFPSRRAFLSYMVKVLINEKNQEKDLAGTSRLIELSKQKKIRKMLKSADPTLKKIIGNLDSSTWNKVSEPMLDDIQIGFKNEEVCFSGKKFLLQYLKEKGFFSLCEQQITKMGYQMDVL